MIRECGFTPLTISELVDATEQDALPHRPIAVTFDDGRADFTDGALPILRSTDVAATLYVVTDEIGATSSWLPMRAEGDMAMMGWDDVRAAAAAGVEIGSHSATHPELDVIPNRRLFSEIAVSRQRLGAQLGAPIRSIAYPHGYHSAAVVRAVKAAGYDSACAVKDAWSSTTDDRFALARMFVWGTTTTTDLRSMLLDPVPKAPRRRPVLRAGWRCARWARHRVAESLRS
jgi:peptidoglycan/xylan/chitin deacetylase (PgdA/CDA1 family)